MNRLRICIGLIAASLMVGALPAHAGTSFRSAKVCAQTQSGIKITGVKFKWTYPGTVGGSGTTDSNGCFSTAYLPIGDLSFTYPQFTTQNELTRTQPLVHNSGNAIVRANPTGNVNLTMADPPSISSVRVSMQAPDGEPVSSTLQLFLTSNGLCDVNTSAGPTASKDANAYFLAIFLADWENPDWSGMSQQEVNSHIDWSLVIQPEIRALLDRNGKPVFSGGFYRWTYDPSPKSAFTVRTLQFKKSLRSISYDLCVQGTAVSGSQKLYSYGLLVPSKTVLTYSEFLQGFTGLPSALTAKSGKVVLGTTLRDNRNQPISGMPVMVSEPKASNPNVGKKVGSCKPVLTATTNAQGKATFTLCPTKNTTITVKAPPLGVVSQSITVTKQSLF